MKRSPVTSIVAGLQLFMLSKIQLAMAHDKTPPEDAVAPDKSAPKEATVPANPPKPAGAYPGIGVEPFHPVFSGHLPESLIEDQGVMVESVVRTRRRIMQD